MKKNATIVTIKTPVLRRALLVEESESDSGIWKVSARGYAPIEFAAETITDAVHEAMSRIASLTRVLGPGN